MPIDHLTDEHPITHELLALVEIPKGSRNKYEYDEGIGHLVLDRFLSSSMVYPTDYGFLMGHRGRDGDPDRGEHCKLWNGPDGQRHGTERRGDLQRGKKPADRANLSGLRRNRGHRLDG